VEAAREVELVGEPEALGGGAERLPSRATASSRRARRLSSSTGFSASPVSRPEDRLRRRELAQRAAVGARRAFDQQQPREARAQAEAAAVVAVAPAQAAQHAQRDLVEQRLGGGLVAGIARGMSGKYMDAAVRAMAVEPPTPCYAACG
jgi:hypothetical protein